MLNRGMIGALLGDPTEIALFRLGAENMALTRRSSTGSYPRVAEIPFDSERMCMTTFHRLPAPSNGKEAYVSFTKGAVDVVIERSVLT